MKRVIYSLYIDIPTKDIDLFDKNILKTGDTPMNIRTKQQFAKHYGDLRACKQIYADAIGADFIMYEYDSNFSLWSAQIKNSYPYLTMYNIINFYKIHLMYELAMKYDEILFLDFDVVPMKNENFFEAWDLTKGIAVLNNNNKVTKIESVTDTSQTIRSPSSKYFNAQAMLFEKGLSTKNDVINTGIVGINKDHLVKLNYFANFENDLKMMSDLKESSDIFPKKVLQYFGWDNETLFSVKLNENNVPVQWLDDKWHYFLYIQGFIPKETILCHTINKDFDLVWRRLNA
jgi:hypothetical protein|nr:hypothetical protein [uncultured Mediterranean phage uvMED]BAR29659.1 hypothetical protein [uncultured Mediterranean phage uvMED]|tara:strand:+ start:3188 stop:4051 length:864 start_codon:yes stop_codon:yes gene_type:complete